MIKNSSSEIPQGRLALIFSAPALLILAVTVLVPLAYAIYLSFHRYNLKRAKRPFQVFGITRKF